jgi:hypothetical protein
LSRRQSKEEGDGGSKKEKEKGMSRNLVIAGLLLVAIGLLWPWLSRMPIGRLPGDIVIHRDNFRLYLPITTSILASILLTLLFWFLRR